MPEVFKTAGAALTTSATTIYTTPALTTTVVLLAQAANVDGVDPADVSFWWRRGTTNTRLANTITVPADASLGLLSGKLVLQAGDSLQASAGTVGDIEITVSLVEIT